MARSRASLTGVYPYGRYELSERLSLWGVAGYGAGTLKLTPDGKAAMETDTALAMVAVGGRGVLVKPSEANGLELAVKPDVLVVRMTSEAGGRACGVGSGCDAAPGGPGGEVARHRGRRREPGTGIRDRGAA